MKKSESDLLRDAIDRVVAAVDGAWALRGDPENVRRMSDLLRVADEQTDWALRLTEMCDPGEGYWMPLPATTDTHLRALLTKALYWLLNLVGWRGTRRCRREGYWCEYFYPYGFVPEAGCPYHD